MFLLNLFMAKIVNTIYLATTIGAMIEEFLQGRPEVALSIPLAAAPIYMASREISAYLKSRIEIKKLEPYEAELIGYCEVGIDHKGRPTYKYKFY